MAAADMDARDQSRELVSIVSIIYGVAITFALTDSRDVVLRPWELNRRIPALALATVLALAVYAYYSYVLVLDRSEFRYDMYWRRSGVTIPDAIDSNRHPTTTWLRWRFEPLRFLLDVALAGAYVRLFLAAADLRTVPDHPTPPRLTNYFASLAVVFFFAVCLLCLFARNLLTDRRSATKQITVYSG